MGLPLVSPLCVCFFFPSFGKDDADTEEQLQTETRLHFHLTTEEKALTSLLRHANGHRVGGGDKGQQELCVSSQPIGLNIRS